MKIKAELYLIECLNKKCRYKYVMKRFPNGTLTKNTDYCPKCGECKGVIDCIDAY